MQNKIKYPELILEDFFKGKVLASGHMTFFYPQKKNINIKANFLGSYKKNILKLKEKYIEEDKIVNREWTFRKVSKNKYIGEEGNILGQIPVFTNRNCLEMKYKFRTQYKSFKFNVKVIDKMFLIEKKLLINKTEILKFKIKIAEVLLLYKKL